MVTRASDFSAEVQIVSMNCKDIVTYYVCYEHFSFWFEGVQQQNDRHILRAILKCCVFFSPCCQFTEKSFISEHYGVK